MGSVRILWPLLSPRARFCIGFVWPCLTVEHAPVDRSVLQLHSLQNLSGPSAAACKYFTPRKPPPPLTSPTRFAWSARLCLYWAGWRWGSCALLAAVLSVTVWESLNLASQADTPTDRASLCQKVLQNFSKIARAPETPGWAWCPETPGREEHGVLKRQTKGFREMIIWTKPWDEHGGRSHSKSSFQRTFFGKACRVSDLPLWATEKANAGTFSVAPRRLSNLANTFWAMARDRRSSWQQPTQIEVTEAAKL